MVRKHTPGGESHATGRPYLERKQKPDGSERTYACRLVYRAPALVVVRFTLEAGGEFFRTPIAIPAGALSDGWFWTARPYNLYRMRNPGGQVIAHRFDAVAGVLIGDHEVAYRDLALDWWDTPDGTLLEEDRDEYEALVLAGRLSLTDRAAAEDASRQVFSRYRHILEEVARREQKLRLWP